MWGKIFLSDFSSCRYAVSTGAEEKPYCTLFEPHQRSGPGVEESHRGTFCAAEGIPKRTVYDIVKRYLVWGTVERRRGSGRPARKMDSRNRQGLKRMVNHKTVRALPACSGVNIWLLSSVHL